jgi:hypothetical protein
LFACEAVKRRFAHESDRIVQSRQEGMSGCVACVVIEEAQTAAPDPWIGMSPRRYLHVRDRDLRRELMSLLIGQRVPPT